MYYLSVDGGGSKTAVLLTDREGRTVAGGSFGGCSYPEIGFQGVEYVLNGALDALTGKAGVAREEIAGAAFGIPCFGEDEEGDQAVDRLIRGILPWAEICICNDVKLGWAGSLGLSPGIHVVAGTGAIAYGCNKEGEEARAGGWHEDFSDEGSGYWLGLRCLALAAKQADGRRKGGRVLELVMEELGISEPSALPSRYVKCYRGDRKKVASLQKVLLKAAREEDVQAKQAYEEAAKELAEGAAAVAGQLRFEGSEPVPVSYSGGIFKAGNIVLEPFEKFLSDRGLQLREPLAGPEQGGILLAVNQKEPGKIEAVRQRLFGLEGKQK